MDNPQPASLFAAGKAKWLLENVDKLTEDERGLLLAIAELDRDTGREVTPEEQEALDKVAEASGFDLQEIVKAVDHIITAEAKRRPVKEWPSTLHELVEKRKKGQPKRE